MQLQKWIRFNHVVMVIVFIFYWPTADCENGRITLLKDKPKWLKTCKRNDSKLNECLQDLFTNMFPELASGIPEIGVAPFEPLSLNRVSVSKGGGAVTLTGSLHNMTVSGPSEAHPSYCDMDLENGNFNFGIILPRLDVKGMYDLRGRVLVLPLVGRGDAEIALRGVRTRVTTRITLPHVKDSDGVEREVFRIDNMQVRFTLDKMTVHFDNLFNGNKVLGTTVNNFLNENSAEVVGELSDNIGDSLAEIFTDLINSIFSKIPTDLWLPANSNEQTSTETTEIPSQL